MARTKQTPKKLTEHQHEHHHRKSAGKKCPRFTSSKTTSGKEPARMGQAKQRYRPGTVALKEIRRYQKSTELFIPKLAMSRVIRDRAIEVTSTTDSHGFKIPNIDLRFRSAAIAALHEAAEAFITSFFSDAYLCSIREHTHIISSPQFS